jgi:hypothetical protein
MASGKRWTFDKMAWTKKAEPIWSAVFFQRWNARRGADDIPSLSHWSWFKIANLVLWARSGFHGFAGKDCELFWSTQKREIPNYKSHLPKLVLRTPHPAGGSPVSKHQTCFGHWVLEFEICCNLVLGIWLFAVLHNSSRLPQGGKTIEAPSLTRHSHALAWRRR